LRRRTRPGGEEIAVGDEGGDGSAAADAAEHFIEGNRGRDGMGMIRARMRWRVECIALANMRETARLVPAPESLRE